MLSNCYIGQVEMSREPQVPECYKRNFKDDLKTALDLFYKFKEDLDKLHPECIRLIDQLVQRPRY